MDWEQDAALIAPAVDKVLGYSCRRCEYLHWWEFLGAFHGVGDGLFAQVVNIRNKRARGRRLEKSEQEFARENAAIIKIHAAESAEDKAEKVKGCWIFWGGEAMASVVINTRFNNRKAEADLKELQAKAKETAREINAVEKGLGSATTKRTQDRLVACVGPEGAVIVETPDAVLVASKDKTQNVKQIVAALKASKRSQASAHRKIHRPWGWYDSIDAGARFQVKRIVVNPGARLSLQMHHHRAEHWIVVEGHRRSHQRREDLPAG